MRGRGSVLDRFTRDLTEEARAGRLDPVRCRDAEIARVIDILLRYGKNNPALVGPAGVGKTAIVEGLAQRVVAGQVPLSLRPVRVLSLDHVALLGGTTYRGQYETRITSLVDAVTGVADVILFIDELHNLIGQGSAMGAAMDAGNMLKPALVRGDFRVIGATTDDEYIRWVCGDPALERRFQRVDVRELSAEDTLDILRSRVPRFERHHGVVIAGDALDAAVRLTDEYVTDRARPDRAIDALDEACAHAQALAVYSPPTAALLAERLAVMQAPGGRGGAEYVSQRIEERERGGEGEREGAGQDEDEELDAGFPDPLERFARTGFDALERFGAELEAAIVGRFTNGGQGRAKGDGGGRPPDPEAAPAGETAAAPSVADQAVGESSAPEAAPPRPSTRSRRAARPRRLAELDILLHDRLANEGIVVRGHDVARAVAVATGRSVMWRAP